jgi:P4 family phage/plasmid primase-like protien
MSSAVPHDPSLEMVALGCVMEHPASVASLLKECSGEDFFTPSAKHVFATIAALHSRGERVDLYTVDAELERQGLRSEVGFTYCTDCVAKPFPPTALPDYIKKLRELTSKRKEDPAFKAGQFNEARAVDLFLSRVGPLRTIADQWFIYADGCWRQTPRDQLQPVALEVQDERSRLARNAKAIMDHTEGRCQVTKGSMVGAIRPDEDAVLINVKSGVLKVTASKAEVLAHSQVHGFTLKIAADYNPNAEAPIFERLIAESLPDGDDQVLFRRFLGSILLPSARHETALVCYGPAGTGKSTIFEAIAGVFEEELVSRMSMVQLCDQKGYHLPGLQRAVLNLGTELDSIEVEDSGVFKKLVSGEAVQVRPIYGRPYVMTSTAKLVFLANNLPRFKNGTDAELRRTRFLRFDRVPATRDTTLKEKLAYEKEGIFGFMVSNLSDLLKSGTIPTGGQASQATIRRFSVSNSPLEAFVEERCRLTSEAHVRKDELEAAFRGWLAEQGLTDKLGEAFFKRLYDRYPAVSAKRVRVESGREQVVTGICLRDD